MPCPHHDVKIIQRSKGQSAVASAAYQSGERLFSEYDQKQKYYSHKSEIVHTEIMLPPHAPPEYADRNTLWNAAEAVEKQWNSQLARRLVLAIPRELPRSQYADLIRDYCREFFVSNGRTRRTAIWKPSAAPNPLTCAPMPDRALIKSPPSTWEPPSARWRSGAYRPTSET